MNSDFTLVTVLQNILHSLLNAVAAFLPRALTALVVILVGFLLAKIIARAVRTGFARLKIDDGLERVGLTELLKKFGLQDPPGQVLGRLLYYLIVLMFIKSACDAVGLPAVSGAITAFFAYLPNIVAALILMIIGMLVARFASGAATRAARDAGIEFAPALGNIASAAILFIVSFMAITQLKIHTEIIHMVAQIVLAGGALAFALSFGLGARDVTRNLLAGFYARKLFKVGEPVAVAGLEGTLAGITAQHVIIETGDRMLTLPNSVFLDGMVSQ